MVGAVRGVRQVALIMSSRPAAGPTLSPSVTAGPSPAWVNRSPHRRRLLAVGQELGEGEAGGRGFGQRREPVDAGRDLGDTGLHLCHFFLLLGFTCSKNMSRASSTRRRHRVPPGSFETCCDARPVMNA